MLDIRSFTTGEAALVYHGANRYWIFDAGNHYELVVDVMDEYCERQIDERRFECSTVSVAIATVEAMESGEEV